MQNKNLLLPLLGTLGAILAIAGLFLGAWNLFVGPDTVETFTFFTTFDGVETVLGGFVATFSSIWATLAMISLLVGIAALVINVVLKFLNNNDADNGNLLSRVLSWIAGIALIAFIVFGIVFTTVNSGSTGEGALLVQAGFNFGIGYWLGLIGLAFGTFFMALGSCMKRMV